MIELLRRAGRDNPDQTAVVTPRGSTTFHELQESAERVAANLVSLGIERFAVLDDDAAHVMAILAGSALAGAESCVYPLAATDEAVAENRERFDHTHLISSRESLIAAGAIDANDVLNENGAPRIPVASADAPLLVMTSGTTTGQPRAVRNTWDRILRQVDRIEPTPDHRWLLAYGINQFGGLQILIHVLAAQATLVVGETFQPRDGLTAMRRWDVTHASGTPTFWRFLLVEMRGDGGPTPELRQVTMSGEAIPPTLLEQVREQSPRAKVSQIYAATEFGQAITVRDGVAGLPTSMLDANADLAFKVVDDELWVRSRAAMLGYYGEDPFDSDEWRATGDLVEIVGDRVEFRGRKTEVINVGGVKIHPLPIEDRISRVPGVALVRAFGRPNAMVGAIVAVEVVTSPGYHDDDVDAQIRATCADLPPAARPRSIRFVETFDMTGNKISRGAPR
ncbi:long-chain fatty acid--CoA ligase [Aeromicrobium sp. A1-2]|uniref:class I adenylate-forming enzyme family protein n=1 Tax=Aeromicrobium sp. A1-2 TaxID=2107713 RepID=UPI000E4E4B4E|nr:class I adenylate-forming enzyme family protein [Aeromicrobium sp. A1-2]AXT86222.1 long-chain fatty acid--CoA ligase [Aeromicrobium sp. A1-2]